MASNNTHKLKGIRLKNQLFKVRCLFSKLKILLKAKNCRRWVHFKRPKSTIIIIIIEIIWPLEILAGISITNSNPQTVRFVRKLTHSIMIAHLLINKRSIISYWIPGSIQTSTTKPWVSLSNYRQGVVKWVICRNNTRAINHLLVPFLFTIDGDSDKYIFGSYALFLILIVVGM